MSEGPTVPTWGLAWARELERLNARWMPALPWLDELALVKERMDARGPSAGERFRRVEPTVAARAVPGAAAAEEEETPVPWDIRARLRRLLGIGADALRAHVGERADSLARAHRADAVTVGRDVFFGRGRFRPGAPEGFALLAHEATHVVEGAEANVSWRRDTAAGVAAEEGRALARERSLLSPFSPVPAPVPTPASAPPVARAMTAASDRMLDERAPAGGPDLGELQRTLFRELLAQLRTELERGG